MAERSVMMLRNEPRVKLELIYDDQGWNKEGDNLHRSPAYILRLWIMGDKGGFSKDIRMRPEELAALRSTVLPLETCRFCEQGDIPIQSSVSDAMVHMDATGHKLCERFNNERSEGKAPQR